jgi:hypothetical protein
MTFTASKRRQRDKALAKFEIPNDWSLKGFDLAEETARHLPKLCDIIARDIMNTCSGLIERPGAALPRPHPLPLAVGDLDAMRHSSGEPPSEISPCRGWDRRTMRS